MNARFRRLGTLWLAACSAAALAGSARAAESNEPAREVLVDSIANATLIMRKYGLPLDEKAAVRQAVEAVVRTADPAARVMTPAEHKHFQEELAGLDYSLGLRLSISNGLPRIVGTVAGSPAAAAGLASNDVLLAANDTPFVRIGIVDAAAAFRGHSATSVTVRYQRGAATNSVSAALSLLQLPAVESAEELPSNLAYLKVNGLYRGSGREIVSLLRGWAETGRSGVVLDLRGADGSDRDSLTEVASLFAKGGGLLFTLRDMADQDLAVTKAAEGDPVGVPVMALVDAKTSGAAEALAAVLNDSVRGAMIIGRPTAGDPLVREAIELPNQDVLYAATRRLVMANGKVYSGREGVKPDVLVEEHDGAEGPEYEPNLTSDRRVLLEKELADKALRERVRGDRGLRRAVDILLGLKALNLGAHGIPSE